MLKITTYYLPILKKEMKVEMRKLQERMKEACEQRMETTFAVSKVSYLEMDPTF